MIDVGDVPRELSELVVPLLGSLEVTGDLFLQYRLVDSDGVAVESVAAFFAELAACGRPATTPRGARQHDIAADRLDPSPLTHANLYPTLTPTSHFRTLRSHTGPVNGVAFTPDERTLATTSATVRWWELFRFPRFASGEVREACLRAGGSLDKAMWEQYARRQLPGHLR